MSCGWFDYIRKHMQALTINYPRNVLWCGSSGNSFAFMQLLLIFLIKVVAIYTAFNAKELKYAQAKYKYLMQNKKHFMLICCFRIYWKIQYFHFVIVPFKIIIKFEGQFLIHRCYLPSFICYLASSEPITSWELSKVEC